MPKPFPYAPRAARRQALFAITPPDPQPKTEAPQGGATLKSRNSADLQQRRRERLLVAACERHGAVGVGALLKSLEAGYGDLAIDRRLERLVDADPAAFALLDDASGAR